VTVSQKNNVEASDKKQIVFHHVEYTFGKTINRITTKTYNNQMIATMKIPEVNPRLG